MTDLHESAPSIAAAVALCLTFAASPALAGESPWYVQGKVGQARVDAAFGPRILGWQVDDADLAAGFELGYALNPYFAVEAGLVDLGSYAGQPRPCPDGEVCPLTLTQLVPVYPTQAEFSAVSLAAVPRWPVTERLTLYGKVGVLGWDSDVSPTPDGAPVDSPSDRELLAGLGVGYTWPKGLGVHLELEGSSLARSLSLGTSWRF